MTTMLSGTVILLAWRDRRVSRSWTSPIEMVVRGSRVGRGDCMLQSLCRIECCCWGGLFVVGWWHRAGRRRRCRRCRGRRPWCWDNVRAPVLGDGGSCAGY